MHTNSVTVFEEPEKKERSNGCSELPIQTCGPLRASLCVFALSSLDDMLAVLGAVLLIRNSRSSGDPFAHSAFGLVVLLFDRERRNTAMTVQ